MKKMMMLVGAVGLMFMMIILFVCTGFGGGGIGSPASPLYAFASVEEAYAYQYIGSELGVPWDITMLADGIKAYAAGEENLDNYNPMMTSLQFCVLMEEKYEAVEVPVATPPPAPGESPGAGAVVEPETEIEWVLEEVRFYVGLDEILDYIDVDFNTAKLNYKDSSAIVSEINRSAEKKSDDEYQYDVTLMTNPNSEDLQTDPEYEEWLEDPLYSDLLTLPDYGDVLIDLLGFTEEYAQYIIELYECGYLPELYRFTITELPEIELPEIVQGDVTREDLARVAISIINHPYLMGGKSSKEGLPTSPLDCSGYVDWVYVQCFGRTVAGGGRVPEGVAVSGTAMQFYASEDISYGELQVGDLGFVRDPATIQSGQVNHVGIYLGESDGRDYWIHCGGSTYGTEASPKGRVGISVESGMNDYNPVDGSTFEPPMKGCKFKFYRRPRFEFAE